VFNRLNIERLHPMQNFVSLLVLLNFRPALSADVGGNGNGNEFAGTGMV